MTQANLGFLGFDYGLNAASRARFDQQVDALIRSLRPLELQVKADARSAASVIRSLSAPVTKTITLAIDQPSLSAARAALRGLGSGGTVTLRAATHSYAAQAAEQRAGLITGQQQLSQLQAMQTALQGEMAALQNLGVLTAAQTAQLNGLRQAYATATTAVNRLQVEQSAEVQSAQGLIARLTQLNQQRQTGTLRNREYLAQATALRAAMQSEAQALGTLSTRTAAQQRAYDLLSTAVQRATSQINVVSGANLRAAHSSRMAAAAIGSGLVGSLSLFLGPAGMAVGLLTSLTAGMNGASLATRGLALAVGLPLIALGAAASLGVKQNTELTRSYNVLRANGVQDIQAVDRELVTLRTTGGLVMQTFKRTEFAQTTAELVRAGANVKAAIVELATGAKLASAEEKDLNEVTLNLHRNLTQFGQDASFAATAGNMLAKASNLAMTNATGLSQGLNIVGATAKLAGFDFADTLGALVELDNKGFDAADMGATGLRGAIAALADPSQKAQGLLAGMNVALKNSDGTARSTKLVMQDLRNWIVAQGVSVNQHTKELQGNAEALSKVSGIMDTRAAAAMLMLTDQWDKNTEAIRSSNGFLDQYAGTMSQGVGPAMKRLTANASEFGTELTKGTMGGLNQLIDGLSQGLMKLTEFARAYNEVTAAVANGTPWAEAVQRFPQFASGLTLIHTAQTAVQGGVLWFTGHLPILTALVGGLTVAWTANFVAGGRLATLWTAQMLPALGRLVLGIQGATTASLAFLAIPVGQFAVIAGAVAALALTWKNLRHEIDATYASIRQNEQQLDQALEQKINHLNGSTDTLKQQQQTVLKVIRDLNAAEQNVQVGKDIWGNPKYAAIDAQKVLSLRQKLREEQAKLDAMSKLDGNRPEDLANREATKLLAEQQRLNSELVKARGQNDQGRITRLNRQLSDLAARIETFRRERALNAAALKTVQDAQKPASQPASTPQNYSAVQQQLYQKATADARKLLDEQKRLQGELRAAQQRGDQTSVQRLQTLLAELGGRIAAFKSANEVQKQAMAVLQKDGSSGSSQAKRTDEERIAWDRWVRSLKTAQEADLKKAASQAELNHQYDRWRAIQTELDARAGRDKAAAEKRHRELEQETKTVANLTRESRQFVDGFLRQVQAGKVTPDSLGMFSNRVEDLKAKLAELPPAAQASFGPLLKQAGQLQSQGQKLVAHAAALEKLKDAVGNWSLAEVQAGIGRAQGDPQKLEVLKKRLTELQKQHGEVMREVATTASELSQEATQAVIDAYDERKTAAQGNLQALYDLEVEMGAQVLAAQNTQAREERHQRDQRIRDQAKEQREKATPLGPGAVAALDRSERDALAASEQQFNMALERNQNASLGRRTEAYRNFFEGLGELEAEGRRSLLETAVDTAQEGNNALQGELDRQLEAEELNAEQRLALWRSYRERLIQGKSEELNVVAALEREEENRRSNKALEDATAKGLLDNLTEIRRADGTRYTVRELLLKEHQDRMGAITRKAQTGLKEYTVKLGQDQSKLERDVMGERVQNVQDSIEQMFTAIDEGNSSMRSQLRTRLELWAAEFKAAGTAGAAGLKQVEQALGRLGKLDQAAAKQIEDLLDPKKFAAYQARRGIELGKLTGQPTAESARTDATGGFISQEESVKADLKNLNDWYAGLDAAGRRAQQATYSRLATYLNGQLLAIGRAAVQAGNQAADAFTAGVNQRLAADQVKQSEQSLKGKFALGTANLGDLDAHLGKLRLSRDEAKKVLDEMRQKYGENSEAHKSALGVWLDAEAAATADLTGELDQRQQLQLRSAETQRQLNEQMGAGGYQDYLEALRTDQDYYVAKVAWAEQTYGTTHALTLKYKADLAASTKALLDAIDAPGKAVEEFTKRVRQAEGKKEEPYKDELDALKRLKLTYPSVSAEIDQLIARYQRLRQASKFDETVKEVQKWAGAISSVMNEFGTPEAQAIGGVAEGIGSAAEAAGKFASGDIAGGITAAVKAVVKLGDSILALNPAFQQWLNNQKRILDLQRQAAGGSSGSVKNPLAEQLKEDLEAREKLVKANFLERLWWKITGSTPQVLDDAAAEALAKSKQIFDQLGQDLSNTFEQSLMQAWQTGRFDQLGPAFTESLNKQIAQMVIQEAAALILASEQVQQLVQGLIDAVKSRDQSRIQQARDELSQRLTEETQALSETLKNLPGFGGLDGLLNRQSQLEMRLKLSTDPAARSQFKSELAEVERQIKELQFKDLGQNIFSGVVGAWKNTLGEMVKAGSFSAYKRDMSQNMKKAVMGAITDAVVAGVNMAGTLQPIIDRLVAAIRSGDKGARQKAISDLKSAIKDIVNTTRTLFGDLNAIQKDLGIDTQPLDNAQPLQGEVKWDTPEMRLTLDGMALLGRSISTYIPKFESSVTRLETMSSSLQSAFERVVPMFENSGNRLVQAADRFGNHVDRFGNFVVTLGSGAVGGVNVAPVGVGTAPSTGSMPIPNWTAKK